MSKISFRLSKHHLPHLPTTAELPLLLLQGGNTVQMSSQSRTRQMGNSIRGILLMNSPPCPRDQLLGTLPLPTWHQPVQQRMTWMQSQVLFLCSQSTAGRLHLTLHGCCTPWELWQRDLEPAQNNQPAKEEHVAWNSTAEQMNQHIQLPGPE